MYLGLDSYSRGAFSTTAATVGGTEISYRQLYKVSEDRARAIRNQGIDVDEDMTKFIQQQVLAALISEEVLNQAAHKIGLNVADYEIAYDIQSAPQFNDNGRFNRQAYAYALKHSLGMTTAEFEEQLRKTKLADRFRGVLYSHYKLTPEEIKYSYKVQNGNMKDFEKTKPRLALICWIPKWKPRKKRF